MSTSEEIQAVFEEDIAEKSRVVVSKFGLEVFYDGLVGMSTHSVFPGRFRDVCAAIERADEKERLAALDAMETSPCPIRANKGSR